MRKICPIHGQIEYLLCSNIPLFTKLLELQYDLCYMTLFDQNNTINRVSASPTQSSSSSSSSPSPSSSSSPFSSSSAAALSPSHSLLFQQQQQQQQIPAKPLINLSLPYLELLLKYPKNSINHPLFITYIPFNNNNNNNEIKTLEDIHNDILKIRVIYNLCEKFILKLVCENLEKNIALSVLNNCLNLLSSHFIFVQLLFEDIIKYSQEELLVFKKYTVVLNISLTVIKEKEIEILNDLNKLLEILKPNSVTFCCITLNVEVPYPDLTNILALLRKYPEYFRIIMFNNKCFDSANSSCDINQLLTQIYENTNCIKYILLLFYLFIIIRCNQPK